MPSQHLAKCNVNHDYLKMTIVLELFLAVVDIELIILNNSPCGAPKIQIDKAVLFMVFFDRDYNLQECMPALADLFHQECIRTGD